MAVIIGKILQFLIVLLGTFYTFECFYYFKKSSEIEKQHLYIRQYIWMFLIHLCCYLTMCINSGEYKYLLYFAIQSILFCIVITATRFLYPNGNKLLINNMCFLLGVGFIMITRLAPTRIIKQFLIVMLSILLGFLVPVIMKKVDGLRKLKWIYGATGLFVLCLVYVMGSVTNGSKLSFSILGISFQPSEFVKILFVFLVAGCLYESANLKQIVISGLFAAMHILILALSKDLGSALIFFAVYVLLVFISSGKKRYLFAGILGAGVCCCVAYQLFAHVRTRVEIWISPWETIDTGGYQIAQSLFALSNGGWFGKGLFLGKPGTIPYVTEDFIFSAIVEELGLIFGIVVILVCLSIFLVIMNSAVKMKDTFYTYVLMGLAILYIFQILLTIGGGTKFIPVTGVTLPLVSYGGSSVLATILTFFLINGCIAKNENKKTLISKKTEDLMTYVSIFFVAVFLIMIVFTCVYVRGNEVNWSINSYNSRLEMLKKENERGPIYAANGEVLAVSRVDEDGLEYRSYPYGSAFSHVVGFESRGYLGVEALANYYLLHSHESLRGQVSNAVYNRKNAGDSVYTTLDVNLQLAAYEALGEQNGAVIVTNPSTGEILAMVSKPDFDPNTLKEIWEDIVSDEDNSVLLNRATQGLYAPGSTFKIITTLEYLQENNCDISDYQYECEGSFVLADNVINCYHGSVHGDVDLKESFAQSCNSSFSNIGNKLNESAFKKMLNKLMFNQSLPLDLPSSKSQLILDKDTSDSDMLQYAIGQGDILMSPIHLNMITQAIANDGILMEPMILDYVTNNKGILVADFETDEYQRLMTEKEAEILTQFMVEVVNSGTGNGLQNELYTVAGKTGSAEFKEESTESHAWFTGFAPTENPQICITVIVEEGGSGSKTAVPVAKKIMDVYFEALAY